MLALFYLGQGGRVMWIPWWKLLIIGSILWMELLIASKRKSGFDIWQLIGAIFIIILLFLFGTR